MNGEAESEDEEVSIFESVTDLMIGVLFVFLILLIFFALNYRMAAPATPQQIVSAREHRTALLTTIAQRLRTQGVPVTVNPQNGVLRLPEDILFDKGSADLTSPGRRAIALLGQTLAATSSDRALFSDIDAILIEGHTDSDPIAPGGRFADNWQLSAARAIATYHALLAAAPALAGLRSKQSGAEPGSLFGVAGYGPERPAAFGSTEAAKRQNRRIDVRFLTEGGGM